MVINYCDPEGSMANLLKCLARGEPSLNYVPLFISRLLAHSPVSLIILPSLGKWPCSRSSRLSLSSLFKLVTQPAISSVNGYNSLWWLWTLGLTCGCPCMKLPYLFSGRYCWNSPKTKPDAVKSDQYFLNGAINTR